MANNPDFLQTPQLDLYVGTLMKHFTATEPLADQDPVNVTLTPSQAAQLLNLAQYHNRSDLEPREEHLLMRDLSEKRTGVPTPRIQKLLFSLYFLQHIDLPAFSPAFRQALQQLTIFIQPVYEQGFYPNVTPPFDSEPIAGITFIVADQAGHQVQMETVGVASRLFRPFLNHILSPQQTSLPS